MREIWYHGANKADDILATGFQVIDDVRHRTDPGDFGLGIYFTKDLRVALNYGQHIFKCEIVMDQLADIPNPYRLYEQPRPDLPSKIFRWLAFDHVGGPAYRQARRGKKQPRLLGEFGPGRMKTVHGSYTRAERMETTAKIREVFLRRGYTGILAREIHGQELAVFDPTIIKDCQLFIISDEAYDRIKDSDEDYPPL